MSSVMSSVKVTLPDGTSRHVPPGSTGFDRAKGIWPRLAQAALVGAIDGQLVEVGRPIESDAKVRILTAKDPEVLEVTRHSTAHLLARAVQELYPETKLGIGPPTEDGFFYDFERATKFTPDDLPKIEEKMREIAARDLPYERVMLPKAKVLEMFTADGEKMKCELVADKGGEMVQCYTIGTYDATGAKPVWIDFCRGPHIPSSGKLTSFKLLSIAGAYWKGSEKNQQLQRIYGTAFLNQKDLEDFLKRMEDARARDHRRIGKDLEIFTVNESVGAGLPLWLPNGAMVRRILEDYIVKAEQMSGYQHVYSPDLAKIDLYKRSGHWEHYHEDMFPPIQLENEQMVLRPMNCPHHILIYESKKHSYRELPVRIAELGTMYRYERSGVLSGLSRVRCMTLNDAHLFCRPDQVKEEFSNVMRLVERAYRDLGITKYTYRLSLRDPANKEKYVDNDAMWERGEQELREAMNSLGLPYTEAPGEAAFYGPKLDIQLADVMGHEETYSTIQVDFHLPNQFELTYIAEDGKEHRPVIIHRGVISTMERMVSYLIELYGGAFPLWLSPTQAVVLPIAERHVEYARKVAQELSEGGLRVKLDDRNEKVNAKIREHQLQKIPYMLVVGDKEIQAGAVSVRQRKHGDQGAKPVGEFLAMALDLDRRKVCTE